MLSIIKRNPLAVTLAILLHLAIVLYLIFGLEWELFPQKARPKVNVVQAHAVDEQQLRDKAAEEKARERKRLEQEAQKRKQDQARKQKLAEEKKRKAERAAKQKAEAQRKAEAERQAEIKRKAEAAAKAKRQAEAKRKAETEAKRKAEAEAKRRAEEAAKREAAARAERERALQEQLAAEQNAREIDRYVAVITQHIERNWWKPDQLKEQLSCIVRVRLMPGGDVLPGGVSITKSSGNDTFDRTVLDAVYRAAPLPVPSGPLFDSFRSFSLRFKPEM